MRGIPDDPTCSICAHLGSDPPRGARKLLTEVTLAWCKLHLRQLPEPGKNPSISRVVCSGFASVYHTDMGEAWPPPPATNGDDAWLWEWKVDARRYGVYERLCKLSQLRETDGEGIARNS